MRFGKDGMNRLQVEGGLDVEISSELLVGIFSVLGRCSLRSVLLLHTTGSMQKGVIFISLK